MKKGLLRCCHMAPPQILYGFPLESQRIQRLCQREPHEISTASKGYYSKLLGFLYPCRYKLAFEMCQCAFHP